MNRFLELGVNKTGRDFVIGDIHGKYDELMHGLNLVEFDFEKDRLIAVGDLIDRGMQNMLCLGLLDEPWFYTVIGNHELMMCDALGEVPQPYQGANAMRMWTMNGGNWYYALEAEDIFELRHTYIPMILEDLPLGIEVLSEGGMRVGITHAGLPRAWTWTQTFLHLQTLVDLTDQVAINCIWTRTRAQDANLTNDILCVDLLINGHTPTPVPVWRGNNVFIDQGAYTKELTPLLIDDLVLEMMDRN